MSFEAAAWAIKQTTKTPTEKLVLIALADCVNASTGKCYPTIPYLAQVAITSERQTKRCIQSLEEQNLIKTHREKGRNNHYKLLTTSDTSVTTSRDTHVTSDNMTPVTSMSPPSDIHDTSSSDICDKSSDTHVPLTRNNQEYNQERNLELVPSEKPKPKNKNLVLRDFLDADVPKDIAEDFIQHRKNKKAPITRTAMIAICKEAHKAGMNLVEVLTEIQLRGWVGFKAEWVANQKTWAQKHDDYQEEKANERYKTLLSADDEELRLWGLA